MTDASARAEPAKPRGQTGSTAFASAGCARPSGKLERHAGRLLVEGVERRYVVEPPAKHDPARPIPLVLHYHGSGGSAADGPGFWPIEELSGRSALFVYLQGVDGGWDLDVDGNDVTFTKALIDALSQQYCVDRSRVFAYGFSFGAFATNQIACALGDRLRAIATIAGGGPRSRCETSVPALVIHGANDSVVPLSRGEASREHWRASNGCGTETIPYAPTPCVTYQGCRAPVVWCRTDEDHGIPAFTSQAIWDFFSSFPGRG
jgi:poly(3-hydroxybutyrate) depolymerase